ncbi:hypothetical protein NDU88_005859 [Pleurodeles waltl]|uniref:Uncharacterized protein n=1 Tax=Pleurodeles waltl TaxID=8319 RepID=A0AAV7LQQ8_PLEWA|nr:hypothetical protein NDU88_005859 [Pleurodeles waltl]
MEGESPGDTARVAASKQMARPKSSHGGHTYRAHDPQRGCRNFAAKLWSDEWITDTSQCDGTTDDPFPTTNNSGNLLKVKHFHLRPLETKWRPRPSHSPADSPRSTEETERPRREPSGPHGPGGAPEQRRSTCSTLEEPVSGGVIGCEESETLARLRPGNCPHQPGDP